VSNDRLHRKSSNQYLPPLIHRPPVIIVPSEIEDIMRIFPK
jgi:hypothetical protein